MIKRVCAVILCCALMVSLNTPAHAISYLSTVDEFVSRFNDVANLMETGHHIGRLEFSNGNVNDAATLYFGNEIGVVISKKGHTDFVVGTMVTYVPDVNNVDNSIYTFIGVLTEVMYATKVVASTYKVSDVLKQLGIMDHLDFGDSNTITVNGRELSYSVSQAFGILVGIDVPDDESNGASENHNGANEGHYYGRGTAMGYSGTVTVDIEVTDGVITSISGEEENVTLIGAGVPDFISNEILTENSLYVDTQAGATISSEGFIEAAKAAYKDAISNGEAEPAPTKKKQTITIK